MEDVQKQEPEMEVQQQEPVSKNGKTDLQNCCFYFCKGKCKQGFKCSYSHMIVCKFCKSSGGCYNGDDCPFWHDFEFGNAPKTAAELDVATDNEELDSDMQQQNQTQRKQLIKKVGTPGGKKGGKQGGNRVVTKKTQSASQAEPEPQPASQPASQLPSVVVKLPAVFDIPGVLDPDVSKLVYLKAIWYNGKAAYIFVPRDDVKTS